MPDLNLGNLAANVANLSGQMLGQLRADVLATLTDPEALALAERATATLAALPVLMLGAPEAVRADLQNEYDAALAVLFSLASAAVEDAAAAQEAVRTKVRAVVEGVVREAVAVLFAGLKIAVV